MSVIRYTTIIVPLFCCIFVGSKLLLLCLTTSKPALFEFGNNVILKVGYKCQYLDIQRLLFLWFVAFADDIHWYSTCISTGLYFTEGLWAHNPTLVTYMLLMRPIMNRSGYIFGHTTTVHLLWYVKNCDLVVSLKSQLEQNECLQTFPLWNDNFLSQQSVFTRAKTSQSPVTAELTSRMLNKYLLLERMADQVAG